MPSTGSISSTIDPGIAWSYPNKKSGRSHFAIAKDTIVQHLLPISGSEKERDAPHVVRHVDFPDGVHAHAWAARALGTVSPICSTSPSMGVTCTSTISAVRKQLFFSRTV